MQLLYVLTAIERCILVSKMVFTEFKNNYDLKGAVPLTALFFLLQFYKLHIIQFFEKRICVIWKGFLDLY